MEKQIICINWGKKYGAPYINRLYAMVARNITPPFSVTCFTDSFDGIRPEVRLEPLPELDVVMPTGTQGIWPKARLWGERLGDLRGPVLFLDLDLVIVGSLDGFFSHGDPDRVTLARNQSTPFERLGQTSIFRFTVGSLKTLQDRFITDPQGIADRFQFEQRYVTREAPGGIDFWPAGWVRHFRAECARTTPLNFFLPPKLPSGAKVVIFPGGVQPPHAAAGHWGKKYPKRTPLGHIRGVFAADRPDPPLRYLRHFILPSDWVAKAWTED